MLWVAIAAKMTVTAAFVVAATAIAERAGPLVGGLVATLPISAGPAYLFVSLDHDPDFIAQSALASLVMNAATTFLALVYVLLAQARGLLVSLGAALGIWVILALALRSFAWTLPFAALLNAGAYLVCVPVVRAFRDMPMPKVRRRWYDVPLRAAMVALVVAAVIGVGARVGPTLTGILAVFPVVITSLILIFQPRIGGPATAALIANTIPGLIGFAAALVTLRLCADPFGVPAGLVLALAVSAGWNLILWAGRRIPRAWQ